MNNRLKSIEKNDDPVLLSASGYKKIKKTVLLSCVIALVVSLISTHLSTQNELQKSCASVTEDFSVIMHSYRHSFCLFEKLLQQEIQNAENEDEIERFLKEQDKQLLDIEGGDYDGVYMYYNGRYLYSWDTPYSAYVSTGYDVTKRPWYIGAVEADGEICFSTPYPSYANDYMLATISRLQDDGETVIAYDIKLGEIEKYVDKLDIYNGALTLICNNDCDIIGSTNHLYQGGNYTLSEESLDNAVNSAQQELNIADEEKSIAKAEQKVKSAEAQKQFGAERNSYITKLLDNKGTLQYDVKKLSFGFASGDGEHTCFVIAPITKLLPDVAILWAALAFLFIVFSLIFFKMARKSTQVLTDVLTGLNNRRAFLKYCDNHMQHHEDETLGLLMLDLNHFKKINDMYGHVIGDHALLDTATVLKKACADARGNFFICRYGGDEFLLAGTKCNFDDLESLKVLIKEGLESKNRTGENPYILEASIGISCGICNDKSGLELLLMQADEAMYNEKINIEKADKSSENI